MHIFEVGQHVYNLRFLPDGERLLIHSGVSDTESEVAIWHPFTGAKIILRLPHIPVHERRGDRLGRVHHMNFVAIPGLQETCYVAWEDGLLYAFDTRDGDPIKLDLEFAVDQIVSTSDGRWLIVIERDYDTGFLDGLHTIRGIVLSPSGPNIVWEFATHGWPTFPYLIGVVEGDCEFICQRKDDRVELRSVKNGSLTCEFEYKYWEILPRLSPERKTLGAIENSKLCLYDSRSLDKRVQSLETGEITGFSFHPNMDRIAAIHSGHSFVKEFRLASSTMAAQWNWDLGRLINVDYSSNGDLLAAGSLSGHVVVWDVEN